KKAFLTFSKTSRETRIGYLEKMHDSLLERKADLTDAMVLEYGGPVNFAVGLIDGGLYNIKLIIKMLETYAFERKSETTTIQLMPVGMVGVITPWNASNYYLINKIATGIAAGCTFVVK